MTEKSGTRRRGGGQTGNRTASKNMLIPIEGMSLHAKIREEYHSLLGAELKQHKRENLRLVKRRENIFKSIVTLHELYETGLDSIARMNNFVPDNVMPDKISK
jgi:hypothetical protein